jgi:hypothetical protein
MLMDSPRPNGIAGLAIAIAHQVAETSRRHHRCQAGDVQTAFVVVQAGNKALSMIVSNVAPSQRHERLLRPPTRPLCSAAATIQLNIAGVVIVTYSPERGRPARNKVIHLAATRRAQLNRPG